MAASWISFLSDYGHGDARVAMCHGVIAREAPEARVIDVCHTIAPNDIAHGAMLLAEAVAYLPVGVHLAVVEAAVVETTGGPGGERRELGVVVRSAEGPTFVGPDNGVVVLAADALGGVVAARAVATPAPPPPGASATFPGRDVYAPVAARLAAGLPLNEVGPAIEPGELARPRRRPCTVDDDHVHAEVVAVDHVGNLALNATRADLEAVGVLLGDQLELRISGRSRLVRFSLSPAEVAPGTTAVREDALRQLMIVTGGRRAADVLRAGRADPVVLARAPRHPGYLGQSGQSGQSGHSGHSVVTIAAPGDPLSR